MEIFFPKNFHLINVKGEKMEVKDCEKMEVKASSHFSPLTFFHLSPFTFDILSPLTFHLSLPIFASCQAENKKKNQSS